MASRAWGDGVYKHHNKGTMRTVTINVCVCHNRYHGYLILRVEGQVLLGLVILVVLHVHGVVHLHVGAVWVRHHPLVPELVAVTVDR